MSVATALTPTLEIPVALPVPEAEPCPIERVITVIGGRWKTMIVYQLLPGPLPYGQLRRRLIGCAERVFVRQVRELERDGVIERLARGGSPPRVDYRLTPLGEELRAMFDAMKTWGIAHLATAGAAPVDTSDPAA